MNNVVVIKSGTIAHAQVTKADKNGILGQAGELMISDFYTTNIEGSRVPLMATLSATGKDKMPLSIIGGFICLLPLFIKGGKAIIPSGTQKTVYTAAETTISL